MKMFEQCSCNNFASFSYKITKSEIDKNFLPITRILEYHLNAENYFYPNWKWMIHCAKVYTLS
jgi:hypothetical protein